MARKPPGWVTVGAIFEGAPVSTDEQAQVTKAGDYRFFAGWRSDPFFFDRRGAVNNLEFTGDDFFVDKNVCSIVLEVPNSDLGNKKVGLWYTLIRMDGASEDWVQAGRGARPLQLFLVLGLSPEEKEAYLAGEPVHDSNFVSGFAHALEHTGGYAQEDAKRLAGTMLPEVMPYEPSCPAIFPHTGRTLTDDAAEAFLAILTNGNVTQDKVGPHRDLLTEFPYLGPPHNV